MPKQIQRALAERTALFIENSRNPILNDHALTGEREGQRSFNVTGDWRLVYEPVAPNVSLFIDIDTHHNLYGS